MKTTTLLIVIIVLGGLGYLVYKKGALGGEKKPAQPTSPPSQTKPGMEVLGVPVGDTFAAVDKLGNVLGGSNWMEDVKNWFA